MSSSINQSELFKNLQFSWMNLIGPNCVCSEIVHPGYSCFKQLTIKFWAILKTVSKFYLIFHLIPYLLKLQKSIREKRFLSTTFKAILHFIGSLLFMSHLVCGLKATLCAYSNLGLNIGGMFIFLLVKKMQQRQLFGVDYLLEQVFFGNLKQEDNKQHIMLLQEHQKHHINIYQEDILFLMKYQNLYFQYCFLVFYHIFICKKEKIQNMTIYLKEYGEIFEQIINNKKQIKQYQLKELNVNFYFYNEKKEPFFNIFLFINLLNLNFQQYF